ncbi:hypothetical protein NL108_001185 [Boleophthalmus pectinirostris]|uniref:uncharacterized protein LOC129411869 n=1 Tax=Boleophthalmus pectinirostris TaxID=150288 RepID=UPI002430A055|nr:uncharacterized protein LOC129411869 [Boleophthalmus pectinirostris]KAJ0065965.1 hypothetical protein NL108_001185 [Boleophthalmus pectinirostris]
MKKKTFVCDESMVITIPIGNLRNARDGQLMPEKFYCVFKDSYKVFARKGKPKPLGAAQAITGVFLLTLGLAFSKDSETLIFTIPSVVFVVCGMLTCAAGQFPNMLVSKLSFFLNIVSFLWSIVACSLCFIWFLSSHIRRSKLQNGVNGLIMGLLVVEDVMAIFLMYWLSKAVCRDTFNSLPTVLLKQGD